MDLLKQEEQRIDLKVLHHLSGVDSNKKLKRFKRTVMALHSIVSQKLYKNKASSLEAYFRDAWKISRAQVYRFLDCAIVLHFLEGFQEQPCKERLCRTLKRLARNKSDMRCLWENVLQQVNRDPENVSSSIITACWEKLLEDKLVTGGPPADGDIPPGMADLRTEEDLEPNSDEENTLEDPYMPTTLYNFRSESRPVVPSNDSTRDPDHHPITLPSVSKIIQAASLNGIKVQPYIDGRWFENPIHNWRVIDSQSGEYEAFQTNPNYNSYANPQPNSHASIMNQHLSTISSSRPSNDRLPSLTQTLRTIGELPKIPSRPTISPREYRQSYPSSSLVHRHSSSIQHSHPYLSARPEKLTPTHNGSAYDYKNNTGNHNFSYSSPQERVSTWIDSTRDAPTNLNRTHGANNVENSHVLAHSYHAEREEYTKRMSGPPPREGGLRYGAYNQYGSPS